MGFEALIGDGLPRAFAHVVAATLGDREVELVVIRLQRFGERRMLPIEEIVAWGGVMRAPYTRIQIEDSEGRSEEGMG